MYRLHRHAPIARPRTPLLAHLRALWARPLGGRLHLVEDRDRQAVELVVGALRDDLVEDPSPRIFAKPLGQHFAQLLPILGLRSGEDLSPRNHVDGSFSALGFDFGTWILP